MNDESEKTADDNGPVGGERLRMARRENDISVRDIAKELHLDEQKVRALEKNDFDVLGAPVFAKGHLRKYAELVGVATDDIMSDYYQMNRAVGAPPVVGPKRKSPTDSALGPWVIGFLVVGAVAAAGYWWYSREAVPPTPDADLAPATLAPFSAADEAPAASPDTEAGETSDAVAESGAIEYADQGVSAPPEAQDVAAAPANELISEPVVVSGSDLPQVLVELTFTGDCWTEVSDASGRRLYYDLGQSGNAITLSGDAPLRVILGDIGNVTIRVDGSDYTVPQSALTGSLARLTLNES